MMKSVSIVLFIALAVVVLTPVQSARAQGEDKPGYEPFPRDPVYEYPTRWKKIQDWIDNGRWSRIRNHGWRLFVGANQSSITDPSRRVFETWYTIPETFTPQPTGTSPGVESVAGVSPAADPLAHRKALNKLQTARYGSHAVAVAPNYTSACKFAGERFLNNGDLMIAGVYFSREYYRHVRQNSYYSQPVLNELWQGQPSAIKNFPNRTFQVKHMYWPVPRSGYAALPVLPDFDPAPGPSQPSVPTKPAKYNGYETWNRAVAVTADIPSKQPVNVTYAWRDFQEIPAVGIDAFYHTRIDQAAYDKLDDTDKCILNQSANGVYERDFEPGDYLVTVAMHVMAREDADVENSGLRPTPQNPAELRNTWSMQTFWYAGAPAGDGAINRYSEDKPTDVKDGPWKNYAMCQSYDAVEPREGDGKAHVCSNPYIELVFPETYRSVSSCISCHARGSYPSAASLTDTQPGRAHYNSEHRGKLPLDYFRSLLFTDFSWSIPLSADPEVDPNQ